MTRNLSKILASVLLLGAGVCRGEPVDFSRDILPILSDNCFHCHGPDEAKRKARLRLDTREGALRTTDAIIAPGKSADSELIKRIFATDPDDLMPPPDSNRKLSERQKQLLKQWIDGGAEWGRHWAFVKPSRPNLPTVKTRTRVRNAVDNFVLSRLEQEKFRPMREAEKRTLIRRVTLDLTGLPPTVEEVETFLRDESSNAYERLVDRLLDSPRYGERMAWDWLDIARYADTNGYQGDRTRTMWPWRDWVVAAFNRNMPYDRFTVEQLAGDMLPNPTREQRIATGFHRNHMINGEGGRIAEENRVEYIFDQVETTATTWLGLTMTCSRCHDHKYDPITLRDYYGLFAIFNNTPVNGGGGNGQTAPVVDFASEAQKQELARLRKEVDRVGREVDVFEKQFFPRADGKTAADSKKAANLSGSLLAQLKSPAAKRSSRPVGELIVPFKKSAPEYVKLLQKLKSAMDRRDGFNNNIPRVMVMEEMAKPRDTYILVRGTYDKPGKKTPASLIRRLPVPLKDEKIDRLGLARWIVDSDNPLTARVTVNRLWQMLFGIGLVKTPEDFGVQGQKPSHPDLLDWLAVDFVESGWDVKRLLKLLCTSATYRQSSKAGAASFARDPENRLLARGARFRLPSWMIRDQALAVSGLLNDEPGGPSVNSYQPEGIWADATFGKIRYQQDKGEKLYRRSLYTFWRRIVGPTIFFDVAKRQTCEVKPFRTNTPLHALATLNDITYVEAARVFAENLIAAAAGKKERIQLAFLRATGRLPGAAESAVLERKLDEFLLAYREGRESAEKFAKAGEHPRLPALDAREVAAYAALSNLILNLDEVITKE